MSGDEISIRISIKDLARLSSESNRAKRDIEGIAKSAKDADKSARASTGGWGLLSGAWGALGTAVKVGGTAIAAGGALAVVAGKKMVDLATDAFETQQKYRTVFGDLTPTVDTFIKTMNQKYGFPTKDLEDFTSAFAVFGKSANIQGAQLASFSTDLVQAGIDLSSFWNAPQSDVFQALQSGLVGMTRPLRQFGIFLSDTAVQSKALEMGLGGGAGAASKAKIANDALAIAQAKSRDAIKKYGEASMQAATANLAVEKAQAAVDKVANDTKINLTDQQKVMVRQKLILEQLGDAQGDLARTSGSMQNQMRGFHGRVQELETTIGMALLPTTTRFVTYLNQRMQPAIKYLQDHGSEWATRIGTAASHMGDQVSNAIRAFQTGGFRGFADEVDGAVGANGRLADAMEHAKNIATDTWTVIRDSLLPALGDIAKVVTPAFVGVFEHLDIVTGYLADHTSALRIAIEAVVGLMVIEKTLLIVSSIAQGVMVVARVAGAAATGGYAAAVAAAAVAEEAELVTSGVLMGVLESQVVSLGVTAAAWIYNTAMMALDTAGRYAWLAGSIAVGAAEEIIQLGSLTIAWVANTAATAADTAAAWAWKAVGLVALLIDLGVQLAVSTVRWIAQGVAITAVNIASFAARAATLAWTAAQWALNVAMDANPIGLIVIGIVALVAVFVLAWQHSETFRNIVMGAFHAIAAAVGFVVGFIRDHWLLVLGFVLGPVGLIVGLVITHFTTIKNFIGTVVGGIVAYFTWWRDLVVGAVQWVWDKWTAYIDFLFSIPGRVGGMFSGMWDGMKNAFRAVINWIIRAWNSLHFTVPSFDTHIPGIGKVGGENIGVPQIPELHSGGRTTAGGLVNMRPGEEIVVLPPAASVIPYVDDGGVPIPSIAQAMSGGSRQPVQLVVDRRVLAEVMIDGVADKVARR